MENQQQFEIWKAPNYTGCMRRSLSVDALIERMKSKELTDRRTGQNKQYRVNDAVLAAFAIFYMQSGSFLAGQRHLEQTKGQSNAKTVFQMEHIPTDSHIRNLLDPVNPTELADEFRYMLDQMANSGYLNQWRVLEGRLAFSLDGVYYFSSQKISCPQCQTRELADGERLYTHSAITPVVVAPGYGQVLPYVPEFIMPQDGEEKQDCEINAAKRWVQREQAVLRRYRAVLLGDDLYSKQPLCELIIVNKCDFILSAIVSLIKHCTPSLMPLMSWVVCLPSAIAIGMGNMAKSGPIVILTMSPFAAVKEPCTLTGVIWWSRTKRPERFSIAMSG
jgi:hypothetical protein